MARAFAYSLSFLLCLSVCRAEDIQARIDAASSVGGGTVRIAPGVHPSPALLLRRGVTLHLEKGAVLQAETNTAAYAATEGQAFILADGADDVAVEGDGTIDGGGALFPHASLVVQQQPRLLWFRDCRNVRVEGVTLRNGRRWTCYLDRCKGVIARKVKILSLYQKCCDGFDIESKDVLIEDCDIVSQDDSIVFKARSSDWTVENVTVRNCRLSSNCSLIKVGTETLGTIRNIIVEDCTCRRNDFTFAPDRRNWKEFVGCGLPDSPFAYAGITLATLDGGILENVTVRRIALNDSALVPVFIRLARRSKRILPGESSLRNVLIEDVTGTALSSIGCSITGLEDLRPSGIRLRNVELKMMNGDRLPPDPFPEIPDKGQYVGMWLGVMPAYGFYLRHADNVTFEDVTVHAAPGARPAFLADDCTGVTVKGGDLGTQPSVPALRDSPILTDGEEMSSWSAAYNTLFDLDAAADDAWRTIGKAAEFDARRASLREAMIERIGGFPSAHPPLNARITGTVRRDGYRVESVIFESRPGAYVTGSLYVPDSSRFTAPHPAAIELCGHSALGKNAPKYRRVAMLAAKCGVATFVVDPLCQGERAQCVEELGGSPMSAHLRLGVHAMLLGHGLAAFELWDAIRALDYLDSRADLRHSGYGALGNSGGGTQSVMLSAIDGRIAATATSSFLSNLREQTAWRLLADSEQLIFAQLRDGLNHAGFALLGGNPVLMLARRDEMIPFTGTRETFRVLTVVAARLGREGWYLMYDLPGPHGYCERNIRASVAFLAERLGGDSGALAGEMGGDGDAPILATRTGRVMDEPGFKSAYSYLDEELADALDARLTLPSASRAALVRRLADVDERRLGPREVLSTKSEGGISEVRAAYSAEGGYRVPALELSPAAVKGAPVLLVGDGARRERLGMAAMLLAEGRPVMLADVFATGEIGKSRHHYCNPNDDEEIAKMLYLTGSSLVGRRAGEIIALANDLRKRHGAAASVVAYGRTAVATAHAFAAAPESFVSVEVKDAPPSWVDALRARAFSDYATAVHGALRHYDWPDLLGR